jgi:hypothetical protein
MVIQISVLQACWQRGGSPTIRLALHITLNAGRELILTARGSEMLKLQVTLEALTYSIEEQNGFQKSKS